MRRARSTVFLPPSPTKPPCLPPRSLLFVGAISGARAVPGQRTIKVARGAHAFRARRRYSPIVMNGQKEVGFTGRGEGEL